MKRRFFFSAALAVSIISAGLSSCSKYGNCELKTTEDSLSYAEGLIYANMYITQLKNDPNIEIKAFLKGFNAALNADSSEYSYRAGASVGMATQMRLKYESNVLGADVDYDVFMSAFSAAVNEDSTTISADEANNVYAAIRDRLFAKKMAEEEARLAEEPIAKENLAKGEAFLAEKEKEAGVKKTESGLLYKVVKEGKGKKATDNANIKINYRGTLIDGSEFDKGNNINARVGQFIPGFNEGLKLMSPGAKYQFIIPADLAYGVRGAGEKIQPNSVIIFDVELLEVK